MLTCILLISLSGEPTRCATPADVAAMAEQTDDQWTRLLRAVEDAMERTK